MRDVIYILLTTVLADNILFCRFEGSCALLGTTGTLRTTRFMSISVFWVMILSAALSYPLQKLVIEPLALDFLSDFCTLFIIACLVQIADNVIDRRYPYVRGELGVYLPLIAVNGAVLRLCETNLSSGYSFGLCMANAAGTGLGFAFAMFLFAGVRSRIDESSLPESFRGMPSVLIAASIVSLTLMGFRGLLVGIFGM